MNPIISIIVPIYNAEKYLRRCIISLLSQGLTDREYEIILINDGSTDNSLSIANEFKEKYDTIIKVLSHKNKGVSYTRNRGIEEAIGEYICFVDADDYLVPNGLSYILQKYNYNNYDVLRYWNTILYNSEDNNKECFGKELFIGNGYDFIKEYGLDTFCINYLYKKDFIEKHNIRFKPYIIGEDFLFVSTILLANPYILSTSSNIYRYIINKHSATTTRSKNHCKMCVKDHIAVNKEIITLITNAKNPNKYQKLYIKIISTLQSKMLLIYSRILSAEYSRLEYKNIIKDCIEYCCLPITIKTKSFKLNFIYKYINFIMPYFCLYKINYLFYNNLIVPHILPKLNRNK